MAALDYETLLERAKEDLAEEQAKLGRLIGEQEATEKKIAGIRGMIGHLSRMLDKEYIEEDEAGLTENVRRVFKTHNGSLIPTEIRDRLRDSGYDISKHGNVMASIHSVVRRLSDRGEIVEAGNRNDGKVCYRWSPKK